MEELATEDSTELATPPDAGRAEAVPLNTVYAATTFLDLGLYTGLHHENPCQEVTHIVMQTFCQLARRHFAGHGAFGIGSHMRQPDERRPQREHSK